VSVNKGFIGYLPEFICVNVISGDFPHFCHSPLKNLSQAARQRESSLRWWLVLRHLQGLKLRRTCDIAIQSWRWLPSDFAGCAKFLTGAARCACSQDVRSSLTGRADVVKGLDFADCAKFGREFGETCSVQTQRPTRRARAQWDQHVGQYPAGASGGPCRSVGEARNWRAHGVMVSPRRKSCWQSTVGRVGRVGPEVKRPLLRCAYLARP